MIMGNDDAEEDDNCKQVANPMKNAAIELENMHEEGGNESNIERIIGNDAEHGDNCKLAAEPMGED